MEKKLKEACGVAGVILKAESNYDEKEAAYLVYLILNALQHRGQESAGIASFDGNNECSSIKGMGLVNQIFNEYKLNKLNGYLSVGHVRYSTTGESEICNAQPLVLDSKVFGKISLAHNGNLVNSEDLKNKLLNNSTELSSNSDSELMAHLINEELNSSLGEPLDKKTILNKVKKALSEAKGAFSLSINLGADYLIGVRDPNGIRPLVLGCLEDENGTNGLVLASETCGLEIVGARFIREIEPGEIILIDRKLETQSDFLTRAQKKLCLFELVYFARPDSTIQDIQVNDYREELGKRLAQTAPVPNEAEIVIGVPDSGTPAAIGYSLASGIPYASGLIKNRYIGRTFIQPTQSMRQLGIRLKLSPLTNIIKDKSIVLIDDSIVRGNTPNQLVKLLKQTGAREVHLRISSPPILWGCFYGIAMKDNELIARRLNAQIDSIRREIGADSLAYLSLEDLLDITGQNHNHFCTACFNGNYPIEVLDKSFNLIKNTN